MKQKLDTLWFGMLIGLIMPIVMLYLFIQNNTFDGFSLKTILELASTNSMIVKLLCIAVFPDMAIVFLLNTWELWRACRQAEGRWANDFGKTPAPRANDYYWLIGDFMFLNDNDMNADQCAIENGYITVVPLQFDMTAYKAIEYCKQYEA